MNDRKKIAKEKSLKSKGTLLPNRKKKREQVDKQAPAEAKGIRRRIGAALRFLAAASFSAAAVWAVFALYRHVTTSEYFAVDDFELSGLDRLGAEEILRTAKVEKGANIFSIDLLDARDNLVEHPWILTAKIERRLPRTLKIELEERRAEAMALFDVPYLVDDTGAVFKRWASGDPSPRPIITGFTREGFIEDRAEVERSVREAVDLSRRYNGTPASRVAPLSEIHIEVSGDFSLTLEGDRTYVKFGAGPYRQKLKRLDVLLGRLRRDGKRAEVIFFDNEIRPDRATVRLRPAPGAKDEEGESAGILDERKKRMSKI